jgi:hypothetical protein
MRILEVINLSKTEADKICLKLFGMNSEDYAKRILKAWREEQNNKKEGTA